MGEMGYLQIAAMPTSLGAQEAKQRIEEGCSGFHESVLRSYHIVRKVKWLLQSGTKAEVVLELMELMEQDTKG